MFTFIFFTTGVALCWIFLEDKDIRTRPLEHNSKLSQTPLKQIAIFTGRKFFE